MPSKYHDDDGDDDDDEGDGDQTTPQNACHIRRVSCSLSAPKPNQQSGKM